MFKEYQCYNCYHEWDAEEVKYSENKYICPICGKDSRNVIPFFYSDDEIENIIDNIRNVEWLKNIDLKYFLKEKEIREFKLAILENNEKRFLRLVKDEVQCHIRDGFNSLVGFDDELVKYCEEHYNKYDLTFFNITYVDLARELDLIRPLPNFLREFSVQYAMVIALKPIAEHQLDELYEAMELREDKGIEKN